MLSERTRQALVDIRDNATLALTWANGMTREQFADDTRTYYACTRCLEIISEAARRVESLVFCGIQRFVGIRSVPLATSIGTSTTMSPKAKCGIRFTTASRSC